MSVLVLTKDEERDLPGCLQSVHWSDDVHVLDSYSTDRTVEIARELGAHVVQRRFDGYASQRNYGLRELPFRHPWVLMLDADERVPAEAIEALRSFARETPATVGAGRMRRRDYWWGRWLRHAQISPFYVRILRPSRVRFEREVNEVPVVDGEIAEIAGHFDHFPFSKGLEHWIAKHNTYSRMEAQLIAAREVIRPSLGIALLGADFNERRVHQKAIFYRLPARPFIKLIYMLVVRRAVLDGWAGVRYAILQAIYEYFIVLKTKEFLAEGGAPTSAPPAASVIALTNAKSSKLS
jgi:glycosyltransferase involved in cell wall biosynthesis